MRLPVEGASRGTSMSPGERSGCAQIGKARKPLKLNDRASMRKVVMPVTRRSFEVIEVEVETTAGLRLELVRDSQGKTLDLARQDADCRFEATNHTCHPLYFSRTEGSRDPYGKKGS